MKNVIEIFKVFFRMGLVAFGGPAAHIALMEDEIISKRKWMSRDEFLDLVGLTNLIPGPNSTEMVMHCGYVKGGVKGLFAAGIGFLLPATVLTGLLAWVYVTYGNLDWVASIFLGIAPAVLVIIAGALKKFQGKLSGEKSGYLVALLAAAGVFTGISDVFLVLGAGILMSLTKSSKLLNISVPALIGVSSSKIFWIFLKIGSILYGSGYVLIAYLDDEFVSNRGWLTSQQLMDAVAMGQFTPGPVLSTSTFIGYLLSGWEGAILATVGIFLPSFLLIWLVRPLFDKMRKSPKLKDFLYGLNAGAIGIMFAVIIKLAIGLELLQYAILPVGIYLFFFRKMNAIKLVVLSGILGLILTYVAEIF